VIYKLLKKKNVTRFIRRNPELTVFLFVFLLIITIPLSGYFGKLIGIKKQKKPIDIDFNKISNINQIFDGFKTNVYNSTSSTNIYCEYSLGYFTSNYTYIGFIQSGYLYEHSENSFMEGYEIFGIYQSDCAFADITFVLDSSNGIDYSKLNIVVYGDGDIVYCNSNIDSNVIIKFDPKVIEITVLIF